MCSSVALILETFKELDGPFERELLTTSDLNECKEICLNSLDERGFLCRSFMFDASGHTCILYDEDPLYYGDRDKQRPLKKSPGDLYRILCGKQTGKFTSFLFFLTIINLNVYMDRQQYLQRNTGMLSS